MADGKKPSPLDRLLDDPHFRAQAQDRAHDLVQFIDRSPTPYHAVTEVIRRLEAAGYTALDERSRWSLNAGGRHYVVRSDASLIAFELGQATPAEAGFLMVGAHTDSPNLRLKPRPGYEKSGYAQLGVEVYGGVLLHTWLDRDLSIAGRVALKTDQGVSLRLVDLEAPVARVPNLAIHLNRGINTDGLKINTQTHLPPVLALATDGEADSGWANAIAKKLGAAPEQILDHDLCLYDVQKGAVAGLSKDFVQVGRLDNLASCHAALGALLASDHRIQATRLIALYDHEEVGSRSVQGAAGPFLESVLRRIASATEGADGYDRAIAQSFLVSADMAHAVHPNFADKHEPHHMPVIGRGPVVKSNVNQSYATDGESAARFARLCLEAGFLPQSFVTRTDLACGSTIGPITAARIGVKTVDVGNPMLSMHSIREMSGTTDVELMHRALSLLFAGA
ncbi:MAG: M18 family aminopeptidase [Deltaproteobacteria bacterium]|nr:M18 family aminopeptidase [Deltaproteobacteria bacterium]